MRITTELISCVSSLLFSSVFLLVGLPTNAIEEEHPRLIRQAALPTLPIEPTTPSTECRNSVYSIGRYLQYHYICCEETGQPGAGGGKAQCAQVGERLREMGVWLGVSRPRNILTISSGDQHCKPIL